MKSYLFACKKILKDKSWCTISNFLTLLRILLTPFVVVGIFYEQWTYVFFLLLFVTSTDLLDGYLARLLNQDTYLGKVLDPIADKILITSSFSALAFLQSPSFPIPVWFVILIVCREFVILLGSLILLRKGINFEIAPTIWGKLNTFFQLMFILWLFICHFCNWVPAKTYLIILGLLAVFSIISLIQYVKLGINYLRLNLDDKRIG